MYLVEILLPINECFGEEEFDNLYLVLTERFGGVTAFSRGAAKGFWHSRDRIERDQIVVVEVMTVKIDKPWWQSFREGLEKELEQDEIIVRHHKIVRL